MKRSTFIMAGMGLWIMKDLKTLGSLPDTDTRMPVLFVGHGSPMNAIEKNVFSETWQALGKSLPRPKAILCISAHWESKGIRVSAAPHPDTIYDFYGFPKELYAVSYPAPGHTELAETLATSLHKEQINKDMLRGFDHGCWSVLLPMYPQADIPVVELSLNTHFNPAQHAAFAKELAFLRKKGVLIIASGNMVHNLGMMKWTQEAFDWAIIFNNKLKENILSENLSKLIAYESLGSEAKLAIPTEEHYLPLLYAMALKEKGDNIRFFNDQTLMGSISMTSLIIGN